MYQPSIYFFFLILGVTLIATELVVLQLTTFWTLFIGLAALITAAAAYYFPELSWTWATAIFVTTSLLQILLLLKPMRKWREGKSPMQGSDAYGQRVRVVEAIGRGQPGAVTWSGSRWNAELAEGAEPVDAGADAVIVSVEGITLRVKDRD